MVRVMVLLSALAAAGCGPSTISVSGKVTYEGEPVEEGSIAFEAPDGSSPSVGGRIEKGEYRVADVPAAAGGKKVVRIFAARKTGRKVPAGPPFPPDSLTDELVKLPKQFNEQSRLSAELVPGKPNVFDFALTKDQAPR